jgi:hypothetical protein
MEHRFSEVPEINVPRSTFNRSHTLKTTFDADYLVPILVDEILPGDSISLDLSFIARMSTPLYPIMDNLFLETFFFAVPYRLLWTNFEKMMGAQDNPADSIDYTIPEIQYGGAGHAIGSLADYMGIPTGVSGAGANTLDYSALPFRAYNLIYREWFRSQDLQNSPTINTDNGPDGATDFSLLKRTKRHDYFTSCLPFLQKGDAVDMPLGTSAPVEGTNTPPEFMDGVGGSSDTIRYRTPTADRISGAAGHGWSDGDQLIWGDETGLQADLSSAVAPSVNELRLAVQTQRLLERFARGGTRYVEILRSVYGVTSPDFRHQRPEYLGGGSTVINISPIANTDFTAGSANEGGFLSGAGTALGNGHGFTKSFTEHCVLLGLANVRGEITYQQGLDRMWSRQTRLDHYSPPLAHIGEMSVLDKEIYIDSTTLNAGTHEDVFGYQQRWAELRHKKSWITGQFRSTAGTSLDPWHLSEEFSSLPTLDSTFIQSNTPMARVLATPAEPDIIFDGYFNMKHTRPLPVFSVPGFIDHF